MRRRSNKRSVGINKKLIYIIFIISIILCMGTVFVFIALDKKETYASVIPIEETTEKQDVQQLNIDELLEENTKGILTEEILTEEIDLEYITRYQDNDRLPKGMIQVVQEGRDGIQQIITKKTYIGEELVEEEITGTKITKSSIDKIVEIGTGPYKNNYKIQIGDTLYVTSTILNVFSEPDRGSEKIITLDKDTEVMLLDQKGEWYQIFYRNYEGWADKNCFTYINPNVNQMSSGDDTTYSKSQLLSNLSRNMSLNKPSGLTLDQFKGIFFNDKNDKNNILEQNAEYFYYIEKQYNINGIFVAAVGIHESAWGTSKIALNKKNLFGYGASDNNPYNNAYAYSNYAESIDLIARVFCKYYLNPVGTPIYDGQTASGKYYNGANLTGVNKKYATDKNWADAVYKWMSYLYNRL